MYAFSINYFITHKQGTRKNNYFQCFKADLSIYSYHAALFKGSIVCTLVQCTVNPNCRKCIWLFG